jgi:branched-subunit amino acid transport protein
MIASIFLMGAIVFRRTNEIFIHMSSFVSVSKSLVGHGLFFMLCISPLFGQQWNDPLLHYPRFAACDSQDPADHRNCFTQQINLLIQNAAKTWQVENLVSGDVSVLLKWIKPEALLCVISTVPLTNFGFTSEIFLKACQKLDPQAIMGGPYTCNSKCIFHPVI